VAALAAVCAVAQLNPVFAAIVAGKALFYVSFLFNLISEILLHIRITINIRSWHRRPKS
jgi:hypothetical protein